MKNLENLTTLVVDDNRHACRLMSTILKAITGAENKYCASPDEAYEILQFWQPGMVITDFQMTPINGLAFARELRANHKYGFRLKPILLMTAETPNQALVQEVKAAGVDTMVTKPIVPETLLARMDWALKVARERAVEAKRASDSPEATWAVD